MSIEETKTHSGDVTLDELLGNNVKMVLPSCFCFACCYGTWIGQQRTHIAKHSISSHSASSSLSLSFRLRTESILIFDYTETYIQQPFSAFWSHTSGGFPSSSGSLSRNGNSPATMRWTRTWNWKCLIGHKICWKRWWPEQYADDDCCQNCTKMVRGALSVLLPLYQSIINSIIWLKWIYVCVLWAN